MSNIDRGGGQLGGLGEAERSSCFGFVLLVSNRAMQPTGGGRGSEVEGYSARGSLPLRSTNLFAATFERWTEPTLESPVPMSSAPWNILIDTLARMTFPKGAA